MGGMGLRRFCGGSMTPTVIDTPLQDATVMDRR